METPHLFDDFRAGEDLGSHVQTCDLATAERWRALFGRGPGPAEAAGVAVAMMMRSYLAVVAPRPPGNIHARQRMALQALPRPGESIHSSVRCVGKEVRRERRYVEIEVRAIGDDQRPLYRGTLTMVWAA